MDFDDELETHLSLLVERFVREGMTAEEARYAALRQFGGISRVKQDRYEHRALWRMETFFNDLRLAIRTLRKTPGFTAAALAALALGIGANTAIFSVVNTVLLKPLNVRDADRIVAFVTVAPFGTYSTGNLKAFGAWQQQTDLFTEVSGHRLELMNLTGGTEPEQIPAARVSASFFRIFGASLLRGRTFTAEEDRPNGAHVAVLSYSRWIRDTGSKTVSLNGASYDVIGVLAPDYDPEQFDQRPEVWVPFQIDVRSTEGDCYCAVTGKLQPGVSVGVAAARLRVLTDEIRRTGLVRLPQNQAFSVEPVREAMVGDVRPALVALAGAVGFVLLIACANVASLLLARAVVRRREMAIRAAVGAGRWRLIRQLLTESLLLSLTGGVLGLVLGSLGIRALLALYPTNPIVAPLNLVNIPRIGEHGAAVALDWRVLAFTVLVSLITGVLFGLIPALQASRADLAVAFKEGGGRAGGAFRQNKIRSLLVIGEVALALILLVGAALLIRTAAALHAVKPGFDASNVLVMQMSLAGTRFEKTSEVDRLVRDGVRQIHSLPGVTAVASSCCIPLETVWQLSFVVDGRPLDGAFHGFAGWTFISPEYFEAFRIPVLRGRAFTDRDDAGAPGVVIINEAMARRFWPKSDPLNDRLIIGRYVRPEYSQDAPRRIVGIVGDVRALGLQREPRPEMYVPVAQLPDGINALNLRLLPVAWIARTSVEPHSLSAAIKEELRKATGLPVARVRSMGEVAAQSTARTQFTMMLMSVFGGAALLLASIGIYGLMAYSVQQRRQEMGIRLALGANSGNLRNMVVFQGMRLAMIGVVLGVGAALGLSRLIATFLFGVKARDPEVFIVVPILLGAVAFLAVWLPARRASRVDPMDALRYE